MKKNKVILVGAINEGNTPTCGETMKNQLFVKRFNELFDEVITVDTNNWKKRPWVLLIPEIQVLALQQEILYHL